MESVDRISFYATLLGMTEIGLGSFLHSLKIPFTGTFLCLNQIFILSRASSAGSKHLETGTISSIAALLKTLAPTGKKIAPMIALFLQGALYNTSLIIFGSNRCGRMIGGIFAMLSSILQPLFFYYMLYGHLFIDTIIAGSQEISTLLNLSENGVLIAYGLWIGIKLSLGALSADAAARMPEVAMRQYVKRATRPFQPSPTFRLTPLKGALKDLIKPFFLVSVLATGLVLFWKEREVFRVLQHVMQTLGFAFLSFYFLRSLPLEMLLNTLNHGKGTVFLAAWEKTLKRIQSPQQHLPDGSLPVRDGSHSGQK